MVEMGVQNTLFLKENPLSLSPIEGMSGGEVR